MGTGYCINFVRRNRNLLVATLLMGVTFLTSFSTPVAAGRAPETKTLHFTRKRSRIVVSGSVGNSVNPAYSFKAHAGQRLTLAFQQPKGAGVVLSWRIVFPSGKVYGTKGYDPFSGRLTETGRYTLMVGRNNMASETGTGSFRLTLRLRSARRSNP